MTQVDMTIIKCSECGALFMLVVREKRGSPSFQEPGPVLLREITRVMATAQGMQLLTFDEDLKCKDCGNPLYHSDKEEQ